MAAISVKRSIVTSFVKSVIKVINYKIKNKINEMSKKSRAKER